MRTAYLVPSPGNCINNVNCPDSPRTLSETRPGVIHVCSSIFFHAARLVPTNTYMESKSYSEKKVCSLRFSISQLPMVMKVYSVATRAGRHGALPLYHHPSAINQCDSCNEYNLGPNSKGWIKHR